MKLKSLFRSYARVSAGLVRVGLLLVGILTLVLWVSLRSAAARVDDSMMDLGRHLMGLSEAGFGHNERGTYLNGQQLGFRVFTVDQDVQAVLDYYENWCSSGRGDFARKDQDLAVLDQSSTGVELSLDRSWRDLTRRGFNDGEGYVACLKHDVPNISSEQLAQRVRQFLGTGNLKDLGQFHYAMATRVDDVTRVVAVWTEGDFYPLSMFPANGDAPGFDPAGISRPPSGDRMLSAGEMGHAETLTIYAKSEQSISELARFYQRDFRARGWRVLLDQAEGGDLRYFVVERASELRIVSIGREAGEAASVTIATTK
jgi:hypothetical protein